MKKFLIISLIALSVAAPVFADDDKEYEKNIMELQKMQDQMFIPSTVPLNLLLIIIYSLQPPK